MLTLIDYGVGNINAFLNIYKQLNIPVTVAKTTNDLKTTSKIILPGVGHFDYAMERFTSSGMKEKVNELVLEKEVPVIGICVGMQMMAKKSDEGSLEGLGWLNAEVKKFDDSQRSAKTPLPHMGWNDIYPKNDNKILTGLTDSKFYFLHSYYFDCKDDSDVVASADYGVRFTCAVNHKNIYGVQFHPEKSHRFGIQLLKNFAELC
jgi:glutamine amidotransferase